MITPFANSGYYEPVRNIPNLLIKELIRTEEAGNTVRHDRNHSFNTPHSTFHVHPLLSSDNSGIKHVNLSARLILE
jgi:hypothetical protein